MNVTALYLTALLTAFGGMLGAVVALLKLRPEREAIIVKAAEGAVIVQSGVIDELQEQLADCRREIADLRGQEAAQIAELRRQLHEVYDQRDTARAERDELRAERDELKRRVGELETAVARLERELEERIRRRRT